MAAVAWGVGSEWICVKRTHSWFWCFMVRGENSGHSEKEGRSKHQNCISLSFYGNPLKPDPQKTEGYWTRAGVLYSQRHPRILTIKGPRPATVRGTEPPVTGIDGPVRRTEGPLTGTEALLIVENAFICNSSPYGFNCRGSRGAPKTWPNYRTPARVRDIYEPPAGRCGPTSSLSNLQLSPGVMHFSKVVGCWEQAALKYKGLHH